MNISELQQDMMYTISSASNNTSYRKGDHVWVASTSPGDLDCIESGGWVDFDKIPELSEFEFEPCYDWVVQTDHRGSTAHKITPEWVERMKLVIQQYENSINK